MSRVNERRLVTLDYGQSGNACPSDEEPVDKEPTVTMATIINDKLITADELARMPEPADGRRHELVRGELITMSPAGGRHGACTSAITRILGTFVHTQRSGRVVCNDTGVITERNPDTVLAPDVAFWSAERLSSLPVGFVEVPPNLAIEVVSPSDTRSRLHEKAMHYLDHGVTLVWLVDPGSRTVTAYRSRSELCILEGGDSITGENALPGFSCRVSEFFDE